MVNQKNDAAVPDFNYWLKNVIPVTVTVCTVMLSIVFWIQNTGKDVYYTKESGAMVEMQLQELKGDMKAIREQNSDIIKALGRIEGRLDSKD